MEKTFDIIATAATEHYREAVAEVAIRVGVSTDYVRKVLGGTRRNAKVVAAYRTLVCERAKAQQALKSKVEGA